MYISVKKIQYQKIHSINMRRTRQTKVKHQLSSYRNHVNNNFKTNHVKKMQYPSHKYDYSKNAKIKAYTRFKSTFECFFHFFAGASAPPKPSACAGHVTSKFT